MIITSTTDHNNEGYKQFMASASHYNYQVHVNTNYKQFGSKQYNAYDFLVKNPKIEHIFIMDSWDVLLLAPEQQLLNKIQQTFGTLDIILFNAEKGCWPYPEWEKKYPKVDSKWRFFNGGVAFANAQRYKEMYEFHPIGHNDNDQLELQKIYFDHRSKFNLHLDTQCEVFQSVAFEETGEFFEEYHYPPNPKFLNAITGTHPLVLHGNGHTDMKKYYKTYGKTFT